MTLMDLFGAGITMINNKSAALISLNLEIIEQTAFLPLPADGNYCDIPLE